MKRREKSTVLKRGRVGFWGGERENKGKNIIKGEGLPAQQKEQRNGQAIMYFLGLVSGTGGKQ